MSVRTHDAAMLSELTHQIIGACMAVHRELGPGLLESVYEECLGMALDEAGLPFSRQIPIPVCFRGRRIEQGFRCDMLVDRCVIVEIKAVERIMPVHKAQVLTYLKLTGCPIGLLINFHVAVLKDGISRLVNPASGLDLRSSVPPVPST